MKRLQIILIGLCMVMSVSASVTLDSCRAWAHANYPAIRQYALIQQSAEYSVSNAARAWIPRVVLSAQATYQSETANMSDVWNAMGLSDILSNWGKDIPDMYMRPLQGKVQVDVHQTIWDGGKAAADKYIAEADRSKQEAQIDVEFYQLDSRVLNVYFGILLLNEQLHQLQRTDTLLRSNLARTRTLYENSIVLASDVDAVEVEVLSLQQKQEQLYYSLTAYREMLSMLVGRDLTREELVLPNEILSESRMPAIETMRPEWRLLSAQSDWIAAQRKSLQSMVMPQFSAFAQGWYGYPTLNMFEAMQSSRWGVSAVVGVRMQWNIGALYTLKNRMQQLNIAQQQVGIQQDIFLYNQRLQCVQENAEIAHLSKVLESDRQIVSLRGSVRQAAEIKYKNGTITVTELLQKITDESAAQSTEAVHKIELIKAQYELQLLK